MKIFSIPLRTDLLNGSDKSVDVRYAYNFQVDCNWTLAANPAEFTVVTADVNATTNVISKTAHALSTGMCVRVASDGTLPDPLLAATDYFVIVVDSGKFKLASSRANAVAGSAIDLLDVGSALATITITPQTSVGTANLEYCSDLELSETSVWRTLKAINLVTATTDTLTVTVNPHMWIRSNVNVSKGALTTLTAVCFGKAF